MNVFYNMFDNEWNCTKIPKIMFSYWYGKMSYLNYLGVKNFLKLNPGWKVIIYGPKHPGGLVPTWKSGENSVEYVGEDWFPELKKLDIEFVAIDFDEIGFYNNCNEIFKSDYARYYFLYKHGGVWSDFDILYLRPISRVNYGNTDIAISYCGHYSIGFMMASPLNIFFEDLAKNATSFYDKTKYQSIGCTMIKKLYPTIAHIATKYKNYNVSNIDNSVVYPFAWYEVKLLFINNYEIDFNKNLRDQVKESQNNCNLVDTVGIHWFGGSTISRHFINENNYARNNTINNIIKNMVARLT